MLSFRKRLLALDARTLKALIAAYGPIWGELESKVEALAAHSQLRGLMAQDIFRDQRFRDLQRQIERQVGMYAAQAGTTITGAQAGAVDLASGAARRTVEAALPRGITLDMLAQTGIQWNRLPVSAFEQFIGFAGDGGPLSRLLAPLGQEAAAGVKAGLAEGIATGASPRQTAVLVRNRFGMPLTRSLTISRTETLRAYREATRAQYQANSDVVKGYRRIAAKDSEVCLACLALDGTLQQTDELLPVHPNDRCSLVPEVVGYQDLGLDVPQDAREVGNARQWFERQPEATQRDMMGRGRFEAWQKGGFDLEDMAKIKQNDTWGPGIQVKALKELVR